MVSKNQKINMVCPFCHKYSKRDLMFEVVFDNFTITFKCEECKKTARIYLKMIEYGQIEYEKMGSD